jgi:hypothetical protein
MKFEIKNRFSGEVIFSLETESLKLCVMAAVKSGASLFGADLFGANLFGADLSRADLSGANLSRADLSGANLSRASLSGANLSGANLFGADLFGANLFGADLSRADLSGANLSRASLSGANLSGANLSRASLSRADLSRADLFGANLFGADLFGANLFGADLSRADLFGANLSRANLSGARNADHVFAQTIILPEGDIIGWKKINGGLAKLLIPKEAKRSNATGRKCRAEYADVLEIIGAESGTSQHDGTALYEAGKRVIPDSFDENRWDECSHGIHFFITRIEAEQY